MGSPAPEDLWHRLVEEAGEDAIASAAGTSVAHAERDLAAAGFDVKAERARANERIAELTGENVNAAQPLQWRNLISRTRARACDEISGCRSERA